MLQSLANHWWVLLIRGICAIAFGILAFALPEMTLLTLVMLYAIFVLFDGATAIVLGFSGKTNGIPWLSMVIVGALGVLTAVIAAVWPGITAVFMLLLIATAAIVRGAFEIVAAIRLREVIDNEWMLGLAGLASVAFGIALVVWPAAGLLALVWLIGAYAMAFGIILVALSLHLRRFAHPQRRTMATGV